MTCVDVLKDKLWQLEKDKKELEELKGDVDALKALRGLWLKDLEDYD